MINKVMVIGSGPIIIGQAAEFDYAGTQACIALREEGKTVVLVNSNPATIMTDAPMADRVYLEPLTVDFLTRIIEQERPDGLLPTLGGQVGLNLALELAESGVLDRCGVVLMGTPLEAIRRAEDRELFRTTMHEIGEPVPDSKVVSAVADALEFAASLGYPVIVRPAYTLGGTGGGLAGDATMLSEIATRGLKLSRIHQVLIERSLTGWKEIEYEVMRDAADTCITICNMENLDPVGIHTGDSVVVAPSQTLADREYQMLRRASLKIIRELGIQGGCNIQFALNPASEEYCVIEVNPRVSRSSALASKATGYPIAKLAAKIAVGRRLDELQNAVTGKTYASFEPALDYVVVKIPRFPFDKFALADRALGTQMKATGEVMAIDRSFEAALLKAVRSLELGLEGMVIPGLAELSREELRQRIIQADDQRIFLVAEAFRQGMTVAELMQITTIDCFFLAKIKAVVDLETELQTSEGNLTSDRWRQAKRLGYSDAQLASIWSLDIDEVQRRRQAAGVTPVYKMVDTCAAEFEAQTPYYYSSYDQEDEVQIPEGRRVVVLGSGPIRIGQGIEFDYCSVHSAWALRQAGVQAIIINNNPETVSTDFDTSDRLYFEPLTPEYVLAVLEREQPEGVVVQFGGQTAINLAAAVEAAGFKVLGTSVEDIDRAEDRRRFDQLLEELDILRPPGKTVTSAAEAVAIAETVGFPALVRPSYVLGGRAMEIVYNQQDLDAYLTSAVIVSPRHPVLVDKYLGGIELEVDAIADGQDVFIPGIMEHIERAGVHSGDSIAAYPAFSLTPELQELLLDYTQRLARGLNVRGLLNIQYVLHKGKLYVLEVNPRASRTVPFLSKVTGIPMVTLATNVILGQSLAEQGYGSGLAPAPAHVAVKVPVFSFAKMLLVDTSLGPEMKSTGEVMGLDFSLDRALYKGMVAAGTTVPLEGTILATIADKDKAEALPMLQGFAALGFKLCATAGTAQALRQEGLDVEVVQKLRDGSSHIVDLIRQGNIHFVINTLTRGKEPSSDGFQIRRAAVEHGIPCLTSLDTVSALLGVLRSLHGGADFQVHCLQDLVTESGGVGACNQ